MSRFSDSSMGKFVFTIYFNFFKIIGLAPCCIKYSNINFDSSLTFGFSWFGQIYNIGLIVLFTILSFFSIRAMSDSNYPNKSPITETIELAKAITGTIILLVLWACVCLKQRNTVKIANECYDIDHAMIKYRYIYFPEIGLMRFVVISCINIFIWINLFWTDSMGFEEVKGITLIALLGPNFVFNWFLIFYSYIVMLLDVKVRAINQGIRRLNKWFISPITNLPETASDALIISSFHEIKCTDARLHEIISEISEFYSFPLLLIVTVLCGSIVYTSYYLIVPFLFKSVEFSWIVILNSLCYLAMEVFPLVTITVSISRIMTELNSTADAVHKLFTRTSLSKELKAELNLFSLELLHRNVQFTCCGIFPLDCTLLHSICSMTATYLIILIQFQSNT